jgi:hypothetical protein
MTEEYNKSDCKSDTCAECTIKKIVNPNEIRINIGNVKLIADAKEFHKCKVFVDHIQGHLYPLQKVICKICGESIDKIWEETLERKC